MDTSFVSLFFAVYLSSTKLFQYVIAKNVRNTCVSVCCVRVCHVSYIGVCACGYIHVCARARNSHGVMIDSYVVHLFLSTNERKGEKDREEKRARDIRENRNTYILFIIFSSD